MRRFPLDQRPAGITEAEEFRGLVESLADSVVDGAAELQVIADAAHAEDLGMAARRQKQAIRERHSVGEPRRQRMGFQVIDGDERLVVGECDGFCGRQPDDHAADQSGPRRGGDAVEGAEGNLRLGHGLGDDVIERLDMGASGDLRHYAAEFGMFADLRQDDIGQYVSPPIADRA